MTARMTAPVTARMTAPMTASEAMPEAASEAIADPVSEPVAATRHANRAARGAEAAAVAPERHRAERFVLAWCRWYTADLPAEVAGERYDELRSDLFEQRADAGGAAAVGRSIVWRAVRGMPADVDWRIRTLRRAAGAAERDTFPIAMPALAHLATALLLAWGVLVLVAAVRLAASGVGPTAAAEALGAGVAGFALASVGAVLTLTPGLRRLGAFALAAGAYVLLRFGMYAVISSSITLEAYASTNLAQVILLNRLLTAAGVLYFVAMAVWWAPEPGAGRRVGFRRTRRAPASTRGQEHA